MNRGDDCIVYRIYGAPDRVPSARSQYAFLGTVTQNQWLHVNGQLDRIDWDYLIVAYSLGAGEGEWGFGMNSGGLVAR